MRPDIAALVVANEAFDQAPSPASLQIVDGSLNVLQLLITRYVQRDKQVDEQVPPLFKRDLSSKTTGRQKMRNAPVVVNYGPHLWDQKDSESWTKLIPGTFPERWYRAASGKIVRDRAVCERDPCLEAVGTPECVFIDFEL